MYVCTLELSTVQRNAQPPTQHHRQHHDHHHHDYDDNPVNVFSSLVSNPSPPWGARAQERERERGGPRNTMNFLQKGLAGLESRLDKVLLDDGGGAATTAQPARNSMHVPAEAAEAARRGSGESVRRSGESARGNMAERLAAVVAAKSVARSGSPAKKATVAVEEEEKDGEKKPPEAKRNGAAARESPAPPPPGDCNGGDNNDDNDSQDPGDLLATIALLREDLAACELRRQEENAAASERIDALSEKVRYLSQESAAAAARERGSAPTPAERKIAEKDEKIALLIEEGERLARGELELRTTIKKLRAQARESAESKKKLEAAERRCAQEREKGRAAAEAEKRALEKVKALAKVESEVEGLKRDKEALAADVRGLEEKLGEQARMAADAEGRVQDEALENERKAASELRAQIERVRSEATMVEEKLKGEIEDLKSKAERILEKARTREREMKAELSVGPIPTPPLPLAVHGTSLADWFVRQWKGRWRRCGQG